MPYARLVAWVRRVRTASGGDRGAGRRVRARRRRIVAHIGSAHTEAELGLLVERARELLTDTGQAELDLGVERPRARPACSPPVEADGEDGGLFPESTTPAPSARAVRARVAAPQVIATGSCLLFDTPRRGLREPRVRRRRR